MAKKKQQGEDYWRNKLTPHQYRILRGCGTEAPFTGEYLDNKEEGVYKCAACGNPLFSSDTKYDSKSGWPSFWNALNMDNVALADDDSLGMKRIEVKCAKCGGHLGHVFDDGPDPTGKRYCINSTSLDFKKSS